MLAGCELPRLWQTLSDDMPVGMALTEKIKQVVWDEIREKNLDVETYVPESQASAIG